MPAAALLRCLVVAALLLMPIGLGHALAAPTQPVFATSVHCTEEEEAPVTGQRQAIDCVIACAALPAVAEPAAVLHPQARELPSPTFAAASAGLAPEAAVPPPRIA